MSRARQLVLILLLPVTTSWGYGWNRDMADQPSEKAQESVAPPGPGSVPTHGNEMVPLPADDLEADEMKEAAARLENPVPVTPESIARGKYFYEINCLVCHGETGVGDGPVGRKFVTKAPVDLNDADTQDQAPGQNLLTLTRGRALMTFYRDALSPKERWEVVNYIMSEFGTNE
jgi:mono/diheme cytochrome c family protein